MHASLGTVRGGNRDESFLGILCVDIRPLGGRDLKDAKSFDDVSCCHEDAFAHMKGAADALRAIGLLYSDVGHCPAEFLEDGSCLLGVQGSSAPQRLAVLSNREENASKWGRLSKLSQDR